MKKKQMLWLIRMQNCLIVTIISATIFIAMGYDMESVAYTSAATAIFYWLMLLTGGE